MSLTIDSTNKGADANSYITQTEADSYFEKIPHFSATWSALDSTTQVQWIIYAALAIDRMDFSGVRYTTTQALEFPRDITDKITTAGEMPQRVKDAQCEMLMYLYLNCDRTTGTVNKEVSEMMIDSTFSVKFKDISHDSNNIATGGTLKTVISLLSPWGASQNTAHLRRA